MKNLIIFLVLMLLPQFANAKESLVLNGYWFECEFSEKTAPPKDQCEMLDDDGFNFKENIAINIKNISSKETKCKKNKIPDVYVLLLEGGKYYVGESSDVKKRISSHKKGKGAAWTKNNEVINMTILTINVFVAPAPTKARTTSKVEIGAASIS